jgi:hypothetical protein
MEQITRTVEERLAGLEQRCAAAEATCTRLTRRLRAASGLALASLGVALFAAPASRAVARSGYDATIDSLINKTQYITCAGGEMYVRNTNLHLENGLGATNGNPGAPITGTPVVNGKGNLIIGYNASRVPLGGTDARTGSHNLVLGDGNNYASHGGMVAGVQNTITAPYASVSGGQANTASGPFLSSVSGGLQNTASGRYASVSGGHQNTASGDSSSVSGGEGNTAKGNSSSVSGGLNHSQNGNTIWQGGTLVSGP